MAPTLYLVRHAEGYHNIEDNGEQIRDAQLTPHGKEQCVSRRKAFTHHDQIDLLLASPLKRTIQTALIAFAPCVERGMRVVAVPDAQESTADPADTGSDPAVIEEWFGDQVDMQYVKPEWYRKEGKNATDVDTLRERAKRLRCWIRDRPEENVVLVAHGNFAHYLTGDVNDDGEQTSAYWENAEIRSFKFAVDEALQDEALLVELEESREERRKERA